MRIRTLLICAFFLLLVGIQASRLVTISGDNMNFFMAALPPLAAAVPPPAFLFSVLLGAAALKAIPAFELSSLALLGIALAIFFARRVMPVHPLLLHPALAAAGAAGFYAIVNRGFFSTQGMFAAELMTAAAGSVLFTLLTFHDHR